MARSSVLGGILIALLVVAAWVFTYPTDTRLGAGITARSLASRPCIVRPSFAARSTVGATEAEPAVRKPIRQVFEGRVVSDNLDKSVVVRVERFVKHPKYHKRVRLSKNYIVHDPDNTAETGDRVKISSIAPVSKRKAFEVKEITRKAIK
uniref:Small ribosomal subunit protein uS17c n=1 Tax=Amorphochlora amoebiformis TaxID=1561963 RepID=A0A7S0CPM0_9EUKA|mmetsp:Transcript_11293/g.17844  ORF Transcript_11293/g.17844 Transcript_11293/m.17844 type:complete len:150 (+) Transcript_11293:62-511(+)